MKNFTSIVLLLVILFASAMPYYNQDNTSLTTTEKQLEEISFSEIFTHNISYQSKIFNPIKSFLIWFITTQPTTDSLITIKKTKIALKTYKYSLQVLFCSFLN